MFDYRSLIIATVSDPHFKLNWLKDEKKIEADQFQFFRNEYRRVAVSTAESNILEGEDSQDGSAASDTGSTPTKRLKKDFFGCT